MSDPSTGVQPPPEELRGSDDEVHEYVVEQVRDVTRQHKVVFETRFEREDTALRQVFPVTYDIPPDRPETVQTSEGE
jgi:hypothetical protein